MIDRATDDVPERPPEDALPPPAQTVRGRVVLADGGRDGDEAARVELKIVDNLSRIASKAIVPPGPFVLTGQMSQHVHYRLSCSVKGYRDTAVAIDAERTEVGDIVLYPAISYKGTVAVDGRSERSGITVELLNSSGDVLGRSAPSDETGKFEIDIVSGTTSARGLFRHQLRAHAPGEVFGTQPASASGFSTGHDVTFNHREPVRIRFNLEGTSMPLVGAHVLWAPAEVGLLLRGGPLTDRGIRQLRTSEAGEITPVWQRTVDRACLCVTLPSGQQVWFGVKRDQLSEEGLLVVEVPAEQTVLDVHLHFADSDERVRCEELDLFLWEDRRANPRTWWRVPVQPKAVGADEGPLQALVGRSALELATCDRKVQWSGWYQAADGSPVLGEGEVEGRWEEGRFLVEIRVNSRAAEGRILWLSLAAEERVDPRAPVAFSILVELRNGIQHHWKGKFLSLSPRSTPEGGTMWPLAEIPEPYHAGVDQYSLKRVWGAVRFAGGGVCVQEIPLLDWASAYSSTRPLKFIQRAVDRARTLEVVAGPSFHSVSNAVIHLYPSPRQGYESHSLREVMATGSDGRLRLAVPADAPALQGFALDPHTGAMGQFRFEAGEFGSQRITLEPLKEFQTQVKLPEHDTLYQLSIRLDTILRSLLRVPCHYDPKTGRVTATGKVVPALYRLYIMARVSDPDAPRGMAEYRLELDAKKAMGQTVVIREANRVRRRDR